MKLFCKKKEPVTYDEKYLVEEINMTKAALSAAYANFDNATDPDLIDCYIYQLNSEQKRYKYLLQKAKESEIYSYIPDPLPQGLFHFYYLFSLLCFLF